MNYEPLISAISKLIGAAGKVGEKSAGHTAADIERVLGTLPKAEKQVPLVHDYLRGAGALAEAEATGATHVRDVSVPVWQSAQKRLQADVDLDPEVQRVIRDLYAVRNTPKDKAVTSKVLPEKPGTGEPSQVSVEVPSSTPPVPKAKPTRVTVRMTEAQRKQQAEAWYELSRALESQDQIAVEGAVERVQALHPEAERAGTAEQTPTWRKAVDYMSSLEEQVQQMRAMKVQNEDWSKALENWRKQQGIEELEMPRHVRDSVTRFEAWADAQKPPTAIDRAGQVLGVPRAVMSSADLSAPGRQGLLMVGRPEYWSSFRPMFEALDDVKYGEQQKYLATHPDFPVAQESGLAITGLGDRMTPREEAFQSNLAEKIPVVGGFIRKSQQAYTTFLNRVRMDTFSNELKAASAAGVDVGDKKFLNDLAEWINTGTGRGGGKGFNPGVLSTILFSPRLAWSRFQTLNPAFYASLHPRVRQQAIKTNLAAAAAVFSLVSLAGLAGAKVTWDFRNADAGKIRIGNTRLDVGGGLFQFMRLYAQIISNQKVNSETGEVTELGSRYGAPTRLDLLTRFLISKEAPVASFVTDWLRGKDMSGQPFKIDQALASRLTPLLMQDVYEALKDQGVQGLMYMVPAAFGVGVQTYGQRAKAETIPFIGVKGEVPPEHAVEYAKLIEQADTRAATMAAEKSKGKNPHAAKAILRAYVAAERAKVRIEWIRANQEAYRNARQSGESKVPLAAPEQP